MLSISGETLGVHGLQSGRPRRCHCWGRDILILLNFLSWSHLDSSDRAVSTYPATAVIDHQFSFEAIGVHCHHLARQYCPHRIPSGVKLQACIEAPITVDRMAIPAEGCGDLTLHRPNQVLKGHFWLRFDFLLGLSGFRQGISWLFHHHHLGPSKPKDRGRQIRSAPSPAPVHPLLPWSLDCSRCRLSGATPGRHQAHTGNQRQTDHNFTSAPCGSPACAKPP